MSTLKFDKSPPPGYIDVAGRPLPSLEITHLNIFVGANNSGKSRFLRYLWQEWDGSFAPSPDDADVKRVAQLLNTIRSNLFINRTSAVNIAKRLHLPTPLNCKAYPFAQLLGWIERKNPTSQIEEILKQTLPTEVAKTGRLLEDLCSHLRNWKSKKLPQMLYIPILRGLRPLSEKEQNDPYTARTIRDYVHPTKAAPKIFTGATMFSSVRKLLLGDPAERDKIRGFEDFLSEHIFHKKTTLIPKEKEGNDVLHIRLGKEAERPIYNVGDGLQTLIALTFPAFTTPNTWLFIEEPEHCLHPGMQRKLLDCYKHISPRPTIFATTHSNHLLDVATEGTDFLVYRFRKTTTSAENQTHTVTPVSTRSREHLQDLGVRMSSVMLTNSTVWVEGICDRWFFRHGLRAYQEHLGAQSKEVQEDTHYSLVEYAGNNITHYSWLDDESNPIQVESFCAPAILVADYDEPKSGKRERFRKLSDALANRFITTEPAREIENLIPPTVLMATVEKLAKITADPIEAADYEEEKIGEFIQKQMLKGKEPTGKGWTVFKDQSGTLARKRDFWSAAEEFFEDATWSDYSTTAQGVIEDVYKGIVEHNWPGAGDAAT